METHNTEVEDFKKAIDEGVMVDEHGFIYIKKAELFRLMDKCTHHQLQKARQDWLREQVEELQSWGGMGWSADDYGGEVKALITRYKAELDQDNK